MVLPRYYDNMAGNNIGKNILKTLAYADIFDCPLTLEELWCLLISKRKVTKKTVKEYILTLPLVGQYHGYFCFKQRKHIVQKRIASVLWNNKKFAIAQKISGFLSYIPTVLLIGVSGGVAVENASKDDDIDICIITKKDSLWLTRLLVILLLQVLGIRRKRGVGAVSNKICLNMFIEERGMYFSKERQNVYIAHEIVQLKVLFERNNMYKKFLSVNNWIEKFLPNSIDTKIVRYEDVKKKSSNIVMSLDLTSFLCYLEPFAKMFQLWYMKKHRTNEEISQYILAFYPFDYKEKLIEKYHRRLKKYRIL